ncbi:MAG: hypothetical protein J0G98_19070 [Terrimonas ferruginea]|jgi:hypothetical protein|uniref:hypothetical protein n=1 Tax=Terrimonas ferruginea TaxID=249 RepID=UPI001AD301F2|nr:hypothetical protein [Terrimonas ferruginea]MBN8785170.1 hypothetical protein [Terrimonas ferruginea]
MRRRDFLYQTGLIMPVLALAPAHVMASNDQQKKLVLIQNPDMSGARQVKETLRSLSSELEIVEAGKIRRIHRSGAGFKLELSDGRQIQTAKLVLDLEHSVRPDDAAVYFESDSTTRKVSYKRKGESLPPPEFWSLRAGKHLQDDIGNFMKRKKPAFATISHS